MEKSGLGEKSRDGWVPFIDVRVKNWDTVIIFCCMSVWLFFWEILLCWSNLSDYFIYIYVCVLLIKFVGVEPALILGPVCSIAASGVNDFSKHWNVPMMTSG